MKKLTLDLETLVELTPPDTQRVNGGGLAQPTTTVLQTGPSPTPPVHRPPSLTPPVFNTL
jgi:hypothetical protein